MRYFWLTLNKKRIEADGAKIGSFQMSVYHAAKEKLIEQAQLY